MNTNLSYFFFFQTYLSSKFTESTLKTKLKFTVSNQKNWEIKGIEKQHIKENNMVAKLTDNQMRWKNQKYF